MKGVEFINKFVAQKSVEGGGPQPTVYVHCKAGRTRSATLVACYLMLVRKRIYPVTNYTFVFYSVMVGHRKKL